MDFKFLFLAFLQLIIGLNLTGAQWRTTPYYPTLPPVAVPNFVNCTKFSTSTDYWFKYTYNGAVSSYCYLYPSHYTYTSSWHEASNSCHRKNATLLSIHDHNANYILSHPLRLWSGIGGVYWIGLNSLTTKRGIYKWSDGSPVQITNFAATTSVGDLLPKNINDQGRCVSIRVTAQNYAYNYIYKNTGQWFKDDCNTFHPYICKKNFYPSPTLPPPPKGGCPAGWYNANQKCIKYFPQPLTHDQAKDKCSQQTNGQHNGELLTIHSQSEQDFLTALAATGPKAPYIGLRRQYVNAAWKWTDQSQFTYSNFGMQLNSLYYSLKFCAIMVTNTTQPGRWQSVYCTDKHPFICEVFRDPSANSGTNFLAKKCNLTGVGNFGIQYRQSCYSIVDNTGTKLTYLDAENHCKSLGKGGHLFSVIDIYEHAFIKYLISQNGKTNMYLTGLQSKADSNDTQLFEWSDGWPVYYTNWLYLEPKLPLTPKDQCVIITHFNNYSLGSWKTVSCDVPYSYICKVTKTPLPNVNAVTNGVCPKLIGNTDKSLDWVNLHKGSQHCYWFSTDRKGIAGSTGFQSWSDASFHCRRRNGTLISLHSNHDVKILVSHLKRYDYFGGTWIGLSRDPSGELVWEDSSPIDYTNWSSDEIYKNASNLNDDSGRVCVEMSFDMTWKQVACNGNKRNYFVCQTMKLFAPSQSDSQSHGGRTAGIVIGVLLGIGALVAIGIYVMRRSNLRVPQMPSFENPLNRSQRGNGIKPQEFQNNNSPPQSPSLTQNVNENPFANKSFE